LGLWKRADIIAAVWLSFPQPGEYGDHMIVIVFVWRPVTRGWCR
jgi:hypothetical protein